MKTKKLKGSVGNTVLAVSSATTILLGVMLYDSNAELETRKHQLGEAQTRIVQIQNDYTSLEQKFLSVESESYRLLKENDALLFEMNTLKEENKVLIEKVEANPFVKMTVVATGYSLVGDSQGSDGNPLTATGTYPTANKTIAVDPDVIPYGSEVFIPSTGQTYIAEDTGGAINGNRIDIYFNHGDEARTWGRQQVEIYVKK